MGWITTHRAKGITNDAYFLENAIGGESRTIVASSTIKNVYYAAVRENAGPDEGQVFAAVILITRAPNSYYNFGWKSQTEHMGPYSAHAPAKVLDALTETDDTYALEWRAACRANLAKKLVKGDRVKFGHTMRFVFQAREVLVDEFTYLGTHGRSRSVFRTVGEGDFLVRLPDWKNYSYEVVGS